jgi:hypothetical protein
MSVCLSMGVRACIYAHATRFVRSVGPAGRAAVHARAYRRVFSRRAGVPAAHARICHIRKHALVCVRVWVVHVESECVPSLRI